MKPMVKVGLVGAGYVLAFLVAAAAAMAKHLIETRVLGVDNSGMAAFGDGLLFLAVFGIATLPATGAAFFFLSPYHAFWRAFSVVALVFAATSPAAFIGVMIGADSELAGLALIRILVAPWFVLAFGLSCGFAPNRAARIALLVATVVEGSSFAGWLITCLVRNLAHA